MNTLKPVAWRRMNPQRTQSTGVTDNEYSKTMWEKCGNYVEPLYSLPNDYSADYDRGAWDAFTHVLSYLNTLENKEIPKKEIYYSVMKMRPTDLYKRMEALG